MTGYDIDAIEVQRRDAAYGGRRDLSTALDRVKKFGMRRRRKSRRHRRHSRLGSKLNSDVCVDVITSITLTTTANR